MIPEYADRREMKRVLFALHVSPDQQDIIMQWALGKHGFAAQALGRTGTEDRYHYATTFAFQLPSWLKQDDVEDMLKRVARDAFMSLRQFQINRNDGEWQHGIVTFFGAVPLTDTRTGKYYDPPPDKDPRMRYVREVVGRLKQEADMENRRALAERHGLLA